MSRSGLLRSGRRSEWSRTARTGHWRRASTPGGAPAGLRPDEASDLSDGIVVQAQLLGRVLGIRLLRIDGTVLLTPARLVPEPRTTDRGEPVALSDSAVAGSELAEAGRLLRENAEVLRRQPGAPGVR